MSRTCMQLAAWLSVAAFLFANTHTSSALSALAQPTKKSASASAGKRACCSHCKARPAKSNPVREQSKTAVQAGERDSSCPCCPERGHCPDGCVVCGIAKAPVTVAAAFRLEAPQLMVESSTDSVPGHSMSLAGELMRPPRF